jgi:ZIP family zinc transporter
MQQSEIHRGKTLPSVKLATWTMGLIPLLLLALLVAVFVVFDPTAALRAGFPPVEELTIQRITLDTDPMGMQVALVNGGPEPVTVAQVLVDDAYWRHDIEPARRIPRLGRATITIPYPWVEGEAHEVKLITNTGLTFSRGVDVAVETPEPGLRFLGIFALLGLYVGVVPVVLGLLWFPFLRRIGRRWINFFLSLTAGLLIFLGVDALGEALESAALVPGAFQGVGLVAVGLIVSILALVAIGQRLRATGRDQGEQYGHLVLSYMIAVGIGLHNLGEGLAIGAAYALGEIALGAFLVVGFMIHNTTEGLGIVAPVAKDRPRLFHLAILGAVAGIPTIVGAWIGGFTYAPTLAVLFLAVGAGAIFQVVYELAKMIRRQDDAGAATLLNLAGLTLGLLIMYFTGLLVAA